ncbi:hypothetical protein LOTGIDRAFT_172795 [Lottia gigantea]|uniref:EF-hand domain-containing protein n=1 Tax=Lottia gigantea TaxID=225164 RepID=V4B517_LOTGI|nr:hypothetical protein LOTGIDRAFT_172795 [Lottia gigantea]ESP01062.1 hypothetical protein LOTGIDRAFT_172795 [Lottia gigantea]
MMKHDQLSMNSEMFPFLPIRSDISEASKSYRSREKTNTTVTGSIKGLKTDRNRRHTSPNHQQNKAVPYIIDNINLPRLDPNTPRRRRYAGGSVGYIISFTVGPCNQFKERFYSCFICGAKNIPDYDDAIPKTTWLECMAFVIDTGQLFWNIRQMDGLTSRPEEPEEINPQPAPFKSQDFLSSTVMKNMPISKRHQDTFNTLDNLYSGKRGQALHTQRYNWDTSRSFDSMSQRDRLIAEIESLERLRDIRRKTEILPHRLPLDMCMGGKRLDIEERFDINREIRRLKAMVLPQYAKDLYHGRGIHLPRSNHNSIKPRQPQISEFDDYDDNVTNSAPPSLIRKPYGVSTQRSFNESLPQSHRKDILPQINRNPHLGFDLDASLSRSNALPSLNRSPASWIQDQNKHLKERQLEEEENERKKQDVVRIPEAERSNTDVITPGAPPPTAGLTITPSGYLTPSKTPYPLKGTELSEIVPEEQQETLRQKFHSLNTDSTGHLDFDQLRQELPSEITIQQENFLKQVYDITSSSTYFGVDEFLNMSKLGDTVYELSGEAKEAFKDLDDVELKQFIIHYVDLFQSVDRNHSGKISLRSLKEILSTAWDVNLEDTTTWSKMIDTVNMMKPDQITKIEYLAHLPYFHRFSNSMKS